LQQDISEPQYQHTPSNHRVFSAAWRSFCSEMH
jgi:hypothetical protein